MCLEYSLELYFVPPLLLILITTKIKSNCPKGSCCVCYSKKMLYGDRCMGLATIGYISWSDDRRHRRQCDHQGGAHEGPGGVREDC